MTAFAIVTTGERCRRATPGETTTLVHVVESADVRERRLRPVLADVRPTEAREWLELETEEILLAPGERADVTVAVSVPTWAEKGERSLRLVLMDEDGAAVGEGPTVVLRVPVSPGRLLPEVLRSGLDDGTSPLTGLLGAMVALYEPTEESLARFSRHLDPHRCPDDFVPLLARWVGLGPLLDERTTPILSTGLGRLRDLVARAADIARRRGTRSGLLLTLTTATGATTGPLGFEIEEPEPFHVRIRAPRAERAHERLIRAIIENGKPASVTYDLVFDR